MISIRIDGDRKKLIKKLKRLSDLDKKGIHGALGEAIRTSTKRRFRTEKDPDGKPWEPSQRAEREGGKTLSDSGILKNSIHSAADSTGFAVGTNVIYARTHQMGEKGRKITIKAKTKEVTINYKTPARPFLGLSEEDAEEIKRTLEDAFGEE